MASSLMSREYKEPYQSPCRDRGPNAPRRGTGRRGGRRGQKAPGQALRGSGVPEVPRRRKPRGNLGGRAASPAVRGVRPGHPNLRVHRRGDRLQDRRSAIRQARARVHEAPLRLLLAHGDVRSIPDVHAHHSVSEVHELPDERVLSHLPPVRPALLLRRPSSSTPTTTAGGSSIPWCILVWGLVSTSSARASC